MKKLLTILLLLAFSVTFAQNEINPNGYTIFRYSNGQIASEGHMRNGQPDGYWKTYYSNGVQKSIGKRLNFQLDSVWVFFSQAGDTTERISYKNGKKNGWYFRYAAYDDTVRVNTVVEKVIYLEDLKQGKSYNYFPTGELHQIIPYVSGKRQGQGFEFDKAGNIITLLRYNNDLLYDKEYINRRDANNLKQGTWKTFYDNFVLKSEAFYKNDLLEGMVNYYNERGKIIETKLYKSGELVKENVQAESTKVEIKVEKNPDGTIKSKGAFQGNKKIGIHTYYNHKGEIDSAIQYNENGQISGKGEIDSLGNKQGLWEEYDSLGSLVLKGKYQKGKKVGKWKFYNKQGNLIQIGYYKNGKAQGHWIWYYEDGSIRREEDYLRGFAEGLSIEYDRKGNIIAQGEFLEGERNNEWIFKVGDITITGAYDYGLRDGEWKYFYADSTLKSVGTYVQDEPNDWFYSYYPNGKLKSEQYYIMGRKDKSWRFYTMDGLLDRTIIYKNDEMIKIDGKKIN